MEITQEKFQEYGTIRAWATRNAVSLSTATYLARKGRLAPSIRLPNGTVLYHQDARCLSSGDAADVPVNVSWPAGTTDLDSWCQRHQLTPDQAQHTLKAEPERRIRHYGTFLLIQDRPPLPTTPAPALPAKRTVPPLALPEKLYERDAYVLQQRHAGFTFTEIAQMLGVTRQRAHQIHHGAARRAKALGRLTANVTANSAPEAESTPTP